MTKKQIAASSEQKFLLYTALLLIGMLLFWGIFCFTRLNFISAQSFIARIGTPLLGWQILLAIIVGLAVLLLCRKPPSAQFFSLKPYWLEIGICLLIWSVAALLWISAPVQNTYSIRQPVAPNYENYPYSDAANYTAGAHALLLGKDYPRQMIDKPLYLGYLALLNLLGGQSFNRVVNLQVLLLAMLPVTLYLIGKTLHSRSAGLILALLTIFKQLNVMATTPFVFHVATCKVMTTEPLTGLILALFLLFLLRWFKHPEKSLVSLLIAGGLLAAASLIRMVPLVLVPLTLFAIWAVLGWRLRPLLRPAILFVSIMIITLTPWMVYNLVIFDNPFTFIHRKTVSVVVEKRYSEYVEEQQTIPESTAVPQETQSPVPTLQAVSPAVPKATAPTGLSDLPFKRYVTLAAYILDRFVINSLTNLFVLPPRAFSDTLSSVFEHYYWRYTFHAVSDIESAVSLIVNFVVIATGIVAAWLQKKIIGLLPLGLNLGYNFGNALTLAAAGFRSVVPVDWSASLYFAVGVAVILQAIFNRQSVTSKPSGEQEQSDQARRLCLRTTISIYLVFVTAGALPLLVMFASPAVYPPADELKVIANLQAQPSVAPFLPPEKELYPFVSQQTTAVALRSRALFPRYYTPEQGDNTEESGVLATKPYSRLSFALVAPDLSEVNPGFKHPEIAPVLVNVNMPLEHPPAVFPHAVDASVIGCFDHLTSQINALAVVVHTNPPQIYASPRADLLMCDLP
ncbi:MAG: hypothetical protein HPY45_04530 [Anaerolineae bacterium]|nr:hypothetical protein [Anaerolineae bacterium]